MKPGLLKPTQQAKKRRDRLAQICAALPEVKVQVEGLKHEHLGFQVRKKTFAYYSFDHHGDGRIALWCKGAPGEQSRLVEEDARRFFVPPYLGARGWVAMRLDVGAVNWAEVQYLVTTAYRLTAPKTLLARLGAAE